MKNIRDYKKIEEITAQYDYPENLYRVLMFLHSNLMTIWDNTLTVNDMPAVLERFFGLVTERNKELILLRYKEGLTYEETATLMGIKTNSVKQAERGILYHLSSVFAVHKGYMRIYNKLLEKLKEGRLSEIGAGDFVSYFCKRDRFLYFFITCYHYRFGGDSSLQGLLNTSREELKTRKRYKFSDRMLKILEDGLKRFNLELKE